MLHSNFNEEDALFDDEFIEIERQAENERNTYLCKLLEAPNTNPAILNILHCAKFLDFCDMKLLFLIIDNIENDPQFKECSDKINQ